MELSVSQRRFGTSVTPNPSMSRPLTTFWSRSNVENSRLTVCLRAGFRVCLHSAEITGSVFSNWHSNRHTHRRQDLGWPRVHTAATPRLIGASLSFNPDICYAH